MIIPFLSKYLKEDLLFSFEEVGWIMAFFGLGAFAGAWLGGKLSDSIGFYKVMIISLFVSGIMFILLQYITSFWGLCAVIFVTMTVADMFRPAMFVSLNTYSKPENRTRSLTLIRLAINLGFAVGPTLAGIAIIASGYNILFWIDGLTCILAIVMFWLLVPEKNTFVRSTQKASILDFSAPVYRDKIYWLFLLVVFLIAFVFFQIFTSVPLYHKDQFNLSEFETGLLFFLNGFVIVVFEMPMVDWIEKRGISQTALIVGSTILITLSFLVLMVDVWVASLTIGMLLITFGEMLGFPYSNAFAMKRAQKGSEGRYMALYSMAFAAAHILSPKIGLDVVAKYGYIANFAMISGISAVSILLAMRLKKLVERHG